MPLLLLILIAALAGIATFAASMAVQRRHPVPMGLHAARDVGEKVGHRARLRSVVVRRLNPDAATGLALTVALALIVVGGLVLAGLAYLIRANDTLADLDRSVAEWGDRHATALSTDAIELVTTLGETWFVVVALIVVATVETIRVPTRWVIPFLVIVVVGNNLLTHTVKDLADRVRPDLNPIAATLGPSFPSGHSSTAAAFFLAAALVMSRGRPRIMRSALAATAVLVAVAVAGSRVLLDVHWLSDVIAGVMLGWAWFAVCAIAFGGRLLRFGAPARTTVAAATAPARPAGHDAVS